MLRITQITRDSLQKQTLVLPDGSSFTMTMYFMPLQQGWYIRELTYGDFRLTNLRITVGPNMLYQWKNKIPFGLACTSIGQREPSLQDDFVSENCKLYVLTEEEVDAFQEFLENA